MNKIINVLKNADSPVLILDFDHTITTPDSSTSIGVYTDLIGGNYKRIKTSIDKSISSSSSKLIIKYYWYKKIKLLKSYINDFYINRSIKYFKVSKYMRDVFTYCKKNSIKVFICSSGYRELIEYILDFNNIECDAVIANDLNSNFHGIISPYNKSKFVSKYLKKYGLYGSSFNYIVVGDLESDINMVSLNNKISIGINNNSNLFDINIDI